MPRANLTDTRHLTPYERLGMLNKEQRLIIETLRENDAPTVYDRLAAQMGKDIEEYRGVSTQLGKLTKEGFLMEGPRALTISGRSAVGYVLQPPYDHIQFPWQQTLFAAHTYTKNVQERVEELVRKIGTKNADPLEVSVKIVDLMLGMQMPTDVMLDITTEPTRALYVKGSETSKEAAQNAKYFSGKARRRVYNGLMQCYRAKGRGVTRMEIRATTGVIPSTLNPRIKELITSGYVQVVGKIASPVTGHEHEILAPTDKAPLVSGTYSTYYTERLDIVERIQALLTTKEIAGVYYADPSRLYRSASAWVKEFLAKHTRAVQEEDHQNAPQDDGDDKN